MKVPADIAIMALLLTVLPSPAQSPENVRTHWKGNGEKIYDTGFAAGLMRHPQGGVRLFDMVLVQNDAPGASYSDKGVHHDVVWGPNRAKKILILGDARTHATWLVFYFRGRPGQHPLKYKINGNAGLVQLWDPEKDSRESYRWVEFPAGWLRKGENTIELSCPEAKSEDEGWDLQLARADEFISGGGDPAPVGKTSFKSFDGGKTWRQSPFGPDGRTRAEYNIRLSLDRYVPSGWLASPVIDLWRGEMDDFIIPLREIQQLELRVEADVPPDTAVDYFMRKGTDPSPFSKEWSPYMRIGSGPQLNYEIDGLALNRRYIQLKAAMSTENPLVSPVIRSAEVQADLLEKVPLPDNIYMVSVDNPKIRYSSVDWDWESWDRPEFEELRLRENTAEVIRDARTSFGAQVRLMDYAAKRWYIGGPYGEYPGWDGLSIVKRINQAGRGGMCIQYNLFLAGLLMAHGWQVKFTNTVGHELIEVWNDDFGKWICLDATNARGAYANHYNFLNETGEPMSLYELHRLWLNYYYPDRPIDWMTDWIDWSVPIEGKLFPVGRGSRSYPATEYTQGRPALSGFSNAAHLRTITRNNWYAKPTPRPLNHGQSWWPWDGYLNWYDERTPRNKQYSWHTDRPQDMWPDLNTVHMDATSSFGNDRLFLHFETYTPNFDRFEANPNGGGWRTVPADWTWFLDSGRNTLEVRAVNKSGVRGKPSRVVLNHVDRQLGGWVDREQR
jgi:hypothetical protein